MTLVFNQKTSFCCRWSGRWSNSSAWNCTAPVP